LSPTATYLDLRIHVNLPPVKAGAGSLEGISVPLLCQGNFHYLFSILEYEKIDSSSHSGRYLDEHANEVAGTSIRHPVVDAANLEKSAPRLDPSSLTLSAFIPRCLSFPFQDQEDLRLRMSMPAHVTAGGQNAPSHHQTTVLGTRLDEPAKTALYPGLRGERHFV
jgi:hypothetical protein